MDKLNQKKRFCKLISYLENNCEENAMESNFFEKINEVVEDFEDWYYNGGQRKIFCSYYIYKYRNNAFNRSTLLKALEENKNMFLRKNILEKAKYLIG